MIRILSLILTIFVFTMPSLSFAKGSVKVGDTIPHDLNLQDYDGKMRSFSDLTGSKGLVLVFVRSANWCPYCQKQLLELDESTARFKEWGYNVVSVSYDTPGDMQRFVTTQKPKLTLLSDPRSESIRAFGILNEEVAKGTRSYGVPYPGVYIVDKNKKVQATFFKEGYKDRPATRDILAKIEQLNPPEVPAMTMEEMGTDPIDPENAYVDIPQEELPPLIESNVGEEVPAETVPQQEVIESIVDDAETQASETTSMDVEILEPTIEEEMPIGAPEIEQVAPTRATGPEAIQEGEF